MSDTHEYSHWIILTYEARTRDLARYVPGDVEALPDKLFIYCDGDLSTVSSLLESRLSIAGFNPQYGPFNG